MESDQMESTVQVLTYEGHTSIRFAPAEVLLADRVSNRWGTVRLPVERATYDWYPVFLL